MSAANSPDPTLPAVTGVRSPTGGLLTDALWLAFLYALLALFGIALVRQQANNIADLWFCNAVAVAFLLTSPNRRWPALLAAAALGNLLANLLGGHSLPLSVAFLPPNGLEILVAAVLLRFCGVHTRGLRSPGVMLQLLVFGAVVPQLLGATFGAAVVGQLMNGADYSSVWLRWLEGSSLGAVSVLALAVYLRQVPVHVLRSEFADWRIPVLAAIAVAVAWGALAKVPFPFVHLAIPLLVAATLLRMGPSLFLTLMVSLTVALCLAFGVFVRPWVSASSLEVHVYLAYGAALIPAQLLAAAVAQMRDTQERLAIATEDLRRANAGLEQFVRIASHDLREPLNTIVQFSDLVAKDHAKSLPAEAQNWLRLVVQAGRRMRDMLDDVLHYVRMQRGLPDPGQPVPLDGVLGGVLDSLAARVSDTGAKVSIEPLPVVLGHETLLALLFQNLISNALKYMPPGRTPEVQVLVRNEGGMAVVTVLDNGIGIAPKDLPKLFLPFSRLHLRKHYEGTGLGLALCRQIAEAHGGRIEVASTPEQGSRFTVYLPRAAG
jgi:signal transduction histidine kinase